MKRIHLGVGAVIWLAVWLIVTTVRDHLSTPPQLVAPALQASRGETVAATCAACHSLDRVDGGVGPHLVGVVGRRAGSVAGYAYSPALRGSGLVWTRDRLRDFLVQPETLVPGTRMALTGWSPDDAQAVIDYLAATPARDASGVQAPQAQGRAVSP